MTKYKLLIVSDVPSSHNVTCACGKCEPAIYIDELVKEEFKELMNWSEDEFIKHTIVVNDDALDEGGESK